MAKRIEPDARKAEIMDAALVVAQRDGYQRMTRDDVAAEAECSAGLVSVYWGRMAALRDAVQHEAITRRLPELVLQGIAVRDPIALAAPPFLRGKAARQVEQ